MLCWEDACRFVLYLEGEVFQVCKRGVGVVKSKVCML